MAITLTLVEADGGDRGPLFMDRISFLGEASYPAGGSVDFSTTFAALVGDAREIVGVIGGDCAGYTPLYDFTNDKLKVERTDAINTPREDVPATTVLSGVTFNVTVLSI